MKLKLYNPNNNCPSEGHNETQYIFSYIYFIQTLSTFLHNTEGITEHCYSSLKLLPTAWINHNQSISTLHEATIKRLC